MPGNRHEVKYTAIVSKYFSAVIAKFHVII